MTEFLLACKQFLQFLDISAIVLGVFMFASWLIVKKAARSGEYSFADMLKDEAGNESILKLTTLASFAISTWYVMYDLMHFTRSDSSLLLIYLSVWASVPVGMSLTEALKTKWSNKA